MTSVLNVQSLKLKLLPTLPLSVCLCWDIRLPLAPDSEANTPPPPLSPLSHLTEGREGKAGRVGRNKRMGEQRQEGGREAGREGGGWRNWKTARGGGIVDTRKQAEIYIEWEREMRMSDCPVHLRDCHEENGQEIQTLHTHTHTHTMGHEIWGSHSSQ